MDGQTSHEFTRIWSQVPHVHGSLQSVLSHVHDISLSALALAIVLLGAVILLELRSVVRLRQVTDRSLARVFEQLDLLRFESQQLLEQRQSPATRLQVHAAAPAAAVAPSAAQTRTLPPSAAIPAGSPASARPVAAGPASASFATAQLILPSVPIPALRIDDPVPAAPMRELAHRHGLSSGEAKLLSSLAEARARRTAAV